MIQHLFINPQQGDLDTVLPDVGVALASGNDVLVFNVDTSHNVIVRTSGSQLIDGALTKTISAGFSLLFVSDGTGWRSLGVATASAPGSAHVIEDEGIPLTQRSNLNFTGALVTATDSGGKTVVNIPTPSAGTIPESSVINLVADLDTLRSMTRHLILMGA